eukprot:CAMPEP_0118634402 /NCGR_PEP_ID=MMETSP0785-20121206/1522_1 /TAXON_ID=91992 /ORGANISM="Bolidomonas pacifica, Strain CCMP 1866" /LENGTH=402 /DNA_ID=CAMNT_0006525363 /DNA_START=1081 /DNA_END=2285 /DNA_ORIENTATION=+
MASLSEFRKWDKVAKDLEEQTKLEDDADRAAADKALGKDKVALSEDHKKEMVKAEQARLAKIALDKQRELEENSKAVITSLPEGQSSLLVDDTYLEGKKVICLKGIEGPGTVTVKTMKPIIKVFVDDCTSGLKLVLDSQVLTSHVEVHKTSDFTLAISKTISTVQLDVCQGVTVEYGDDLFEGDDDRVYFAGVSDLTIKYKGQAIQCDYKRDGATKVNEASEEEYQFVVWYEKGSLKKDSLMRIGNKFLTGSTVENSALDDVAREAIALEKLKEAEQHKLEGNDAFKQGEYAQAVLFYTMAIDKVEGSSVPSAAPSDPKKPSLQATCLANRSACFLKLGHHEKALDDGKACAEADPKYIKGHFRRGLALHAMGRYKEALESLVKALELEPKNKQVKDAMKFA